MRRWFYRQLDPGAREAPGLSPLNWLISIVIVAAVAALVLETESTLSGPHATAFRVLNLVFAALFGVEYGLRVWAAGEAPEHAGVLGRLRYMVTPMALIDLAAIVPFFLSAGVHDAFLLRLFRVLRILALARIGSYSGALRTIVTAFHQRRHELVMSLVAAGVVMLMSASALHWAEGEGNPESFGSIPRALWWGAATITKVGYGGAYRATVAGRIFAALFAVAAVAVVAMPTGILAASFSEAFQRQRAGDGPKDS